LWSIEEGECWRGSCLEWLGFKTKVIIIIIFFECILISFDDHIFRRLGDSLIFLPIRDRSGVVQLVFLNDSLILSSFDNEFFFFSETIEIQFRKSKSELFSKIESISSETVVNVKGKVRARPDVMNNNVLLFLLRL